MLCLYIQSFDQPVGIAVIGLAQLSKSRPSGGAEPIPQPSQVKRGMESLMACSSFGIALSWGRGFLSALPKIDFEILG